MNRRRIICSFFAPASLIVSLAIVAAAVSQAPIPSTTSSAVESPLSPQESLEQLVVEPGLKVELAAHEPQVVDPIEIRFDEDGRMWVVEMCDYPTSPEGGPRSRISVLTDRDGDGFFETARVFADGLAYATGLQPWKGGVFVTLAGEVAYMKDTDGDGRADVRDVWFTGFAEENTQQRANHPRLALDNRIYIANGVRGGKIVNVRRPNSPPVDISGRDFCFDPLTGECEAVSGLAQFGLAFDDYGNRFGCSNRNPAMHVVLEDRYLRKAPLVAVPAVVEDVAQPGDASRVYPLARSWTTSNLHAGQFTAACGLEIFRGDALGSAYRSNLFVCEPTGHLVHREIVRPSGVTFKSAPAHEGREFLASRDPWFSPVNLETGPDGALYVVDMYRAVIEHPEWMPDELRNRPDLLAGSDRGRIYRIVAKNFRRPIAAPLSVKPSEELVELLAAPNAWQRETAVRLLLERQDASVVPKLRDLVAHHESAIARIHALWLLEGLNRVDDDLLLRAVSEGNPRVVEQAILICERQRMPAKLHAKVASLARHDDARVRFTALLAATPLPRAPQFRVDDWELQAMLIATGDRGADALAGMLHDVPAWKANVSDASKLVSELARLAGTTDDRQLVRAIELLLNSEDFCRAGLVAALAGAERRAVGFDAARSKLPKDAQTKLDRVLAAARSTVADATCADAARCEAIELVALTDDAAEVLVPIAVSEASQPVRLRAIAALARSSGPAVWRQLLATFPSETPRVQAAILDGVFADGARTALLLDELEAERIRPGQLDTYRTSQLLAHGDASLRERAKALLAEAVPQDRARVLAEYQAALGIKADARQGRIVFEKQCASCHRVDNVGVNVAPDISDSREKPAQQLLTDILQPNRAIDANYFSYTAVTSDGQVHTGILAAETSTSITLRQAEGTATTLRREDLDELYSNGVSLMPDGLERLISRQDMADLISFIKNWRYLDDSGIQPDSARRGDGID